jgi:cephalosporin-C deacetylase-like acetyl esterase
MNQMELLKSWACLALAVCVVSGHAAERQQVMGEVYRNGDGNWEYRTERYVAVVHGKTGRLQSLLVEGKELLAQGQPDAAGGMLYAAGKPFVASLVPLNRFATVGAWDGNFGMWWHFRPDGIKLEYAVNQAAQPTLTFVLNPAVVASVPAPAPLKHRWLAGHILHESWAFGVTGVAVAGQFATPIAFQGLDVTVLKDWNGRPAPTVVYALPQGKRVGGEIHIGSALPLVEATVQPYFTGPRHHLFPPAGKIEFQTSVMLEAATAKNLDIAVVLSDYNTRETLAEPVQTVTCEPKRRVTQNWSVPWNRPGVFRGSVRARTPQGTIGVHDFVFLYDLAHWQPELYRPSDFWAFWEGQLKAMRAQPLDAKVTPLPEKSNAEVQAFAVEITGCNGRRIKGEYSEPVKAGKYPVLLSTPHPGKDLRVGATEPTVMVYGELDDVAKYRKDVGDLTKSNFLHVYLDYVRWLDFAESRGKADWSRCFAPAGSRGGPMVIAAAALDKRIKLIWMNVGTCNRWDWQVQYTSGWGPYMTDRLPGQSEAEFLKVLGYFDSSHFAERVTIPVCASWGLMDGLSPINGQLSMWVNLQGPKLLELRETGGHDNNTPAFTKLSDIVRRRVFSGQPLPDTGPLGLNWEALVY